MDVEKLILRFAEKKMGEILISDPDGKMIYRNHSLDFSDEDWERWVERNLPGGGITEDTDWEILEGDREGDYRVRSVPITQDGERYVMHHIYDVSDDFDLIRELSAYTKERQQMVVFQREMLEKISGRLSDCLPVILRFLKVDEVVLCVERNNLVETFDMRAENMEIRVRREKPDGQFDIPREEHVQNRYEQNKDYLCYMTEMTVSGKRFAVYLPGEIDDAWDTFPLHFGVIRLFIDNVLLREEIVYKSEHDPLTGIYNKGKYLSMMEHYFPTCERIAIYNMDVNYLKRLNDSLGHEAGDKLLRRAAKSMIPLESDHVSAYRMGGDEFMMVAWDLDEAEAQELKKRWLEELDRLNREEGEFECVVACGLVYGGPGHDLDAMLKEADELMYQDKVAIKRARGDDPDAR